MGGRGLFDAGSDPPPHNPQPDRQGRQHEDLRGAVSRQEQEKQRDFWSCIDTCTRGDVTTVKTILGAENQLVNFVPNGSSGLLFKASQHCQKEVVKSRARAVMHTK